MSDEWTVGAIAETAAEMVHGTPWDCVAVAKDGGSDWWAITFRHAHGPYQVANMSTAVPCNDQGRKYLRELLADLVAKPLPFEAFGPGDEPPSVYARLPRGHLGKPIGVDDFEIGMAFTLVSIDRDQGVAELRLNEWTWGPES